MGTYILDQQNVGGTSAYAPRYNYTILVALLCQGEWVLLPNKFDSVGWRARMAKENKIIKIMVQNKPTKWMHLDSETEQTQLNFPSFTIIMYVKETTIKNISI